MIIGKAVLDPQRSEAIMGSAQMRMLFESVKLELTNALAAHGEFSTMHEAYAVTLEELDELKGLVFSRGREYRDYTEMQRESIQVAAMAIKTMLFCEKMREYLNTQDL